MLNPEATPSRRQRVLAQATACILDAVPSASQFLFYSATLTKEVTQLINQAMLGSGEMEICENMLEYVNIYYTYDQTYDTTYTYDTHIQMIHIYI